MSEQISKELPSTAGRHVSHLTRNTYAIVLAGGRGSRLMQLTDWRAKPAVPFGGKFRIIDFALSNCVNSGIRRIGVATQYKAQSLIRHIQHAWSFLEGRFHEGVDLMPAQQMMGEGWYRGTADAVYQNIDLLRHNRPKYVLVLSGDHIYKMDYGRMLAEHVWNDAELTVACIDVPIEDAKGFGVIGIDADNRVQSFVEKPEEPPTMPGDPERSLASMGIYVFNADFLYEQLLRDCADENSSNDFGKDIIPHVIKHHRVFAHSFKASCVGGVSPDKPYWRDVGTIDAYWEANMELTKVSPELNMYDEEWPIWTHQEQMPPAKFVFDDDDRRGIAVDSLVSGGDIISGATIRRSLLFSRVNAYDHALVEDSIILQGVDIGAGAKIRRAVIDKRCKIPPGMKIGYDLEEDRKRFYVSEKGIVLVTQDMLGQRAPRIG